MRAPRDGRRRLVAAARRTCLPFIPVPKPRTLTPGKGAGIRKCRLPYAFVIQAAGNNTWRKSAEVKNGAGVVERIFEPGNQRYCRERDNEEVDAGRGGFSLRTVKCLLNLLQILLAQATLQLLLCYYIATLLIQVINNITQVLQKKIRALGVISIFSILGHFTQEPYIIGKVGLAHRQERGA